MIDDFCILLSTGACLFVILRAVRLDRVLPWFAVKATIPDPDTSSSTAVQAGWRARAAASRAPAGN